MLPGDDSGCGCGRGGRPHRAVGGDVGAVQVPAVVAGQVVAPQLAVRPAGQHLARLRHKDAQRQGAPAPRGVVDLGAQLHRLWGGRAKSVPLH